MQSSTYWWPVTRILSIRKDPIVQSCLWGSTAAPELLYFSSTGDWWKGSAMLRGDGLVAAISLLGLLSGIANAEPLQPGRSAADTSLPERAAAAALQPALPLTELRIAGTPPAPILNIPADGIKFTDPALTFNWRDGEGTPRAVSFRLCVAEDGVPCSDPRALIYPASGQPDLAATVFAVPAGLPAALHGKRLQWSVAACAPNQAITSIDGAHPIGCTWAKSRSLSWDFPAPLLVGPTAGASLDPVGRAFAWQYGNTVGLTRFVLCLAQPGVPCGTPGGSHLMEVNDLTTRSLSLGNGYLTWFENMRVNWAIGACNAARQCAWSESRTLNFPILPGSYFHVESIALNPKCTNCHGMAAGNARYRDHVAQQRFAAGTDPTSQSLCVRCHTRATGYSDVWRAPSRFSDFSPGGSVRGCLDFRSLVRDRLTMVNHLRADELVLWSIDHSAGLTRAQWLRAVDAWNAINMRCPREDPSNTFYNPWWKAGPGARL